MLKVDPAHRRTAKEILNHPWITVCSHFDLFLCCLSNKFWTWEALLQWNHLLGGEDVCLFAF